MFNCGLQGIDMANIEAAHVIDESKAQSRLYKVYYPELDALRFMAFLAVYVCHSIPNTLSSKTSPVLVNIKDMGNFGVCLFFLLSAFLITDLLVREYQEFGFIHIEAFYIRRILRIWPLYFGIVGVYGFGAFIFPALRIEPGRIAAYLLLAGNWYIFLHPWILTPLRALWSISVEEQFYLLWPWLVQYLDRRILIYVSVAITIGSLSTIYSVSTAQPFAYVTVWVNSFTQFQFFACGALLAVILRGHLPRIASAVRAAMVFSALSFWWIAAAVTQIKRPGASPSSYKFCVGYFLVAVGCVLVFLAIFGISANRVPAFVRYLGKISFGLYVFHEAAFLLVDKLQRLVGDMSFPVSRWLSRHVLYTLMMNKSAALVVTVMLAALSYRFWETPFLRLKERVTFVESRSV
jgi:peptidoglycan/LPS O-acetylase OafA/YrhL